jgi:hypothetical protein
MRGKLNLANLAGWITLALGCVSLIGATIYNHQILAFIGLGLTFWGIILTYIRSEEYVKESFMDAACLSPLEALNQLMDKLGYTEKAVYLPPKYMKEPENSKAFIPKGKLSTLPKPEQTQREDIDLSIENPEGLLITPPGNDLTKLFEKTLETSFTRVDFQYLQLNFPKIFIEELEIAQDIEIKMENNKIHVKLENSPYTHLAKEISKLSKVYESLGCPLSSAIACALAKATGKPVKIEKQEINEAARTMMIEYSLLEEDAKS